MARTMPGMRVSVVARLVSPTFSVIFGGIACVFGAGLVALLYPELRRARAPRAS